MVRHRTRPIDLRQLAASQTTKSKKFENFQKWKEHHKRDIDYFFEKMKDKNMFLDVSGKWFEGTHGHEVSEEHLKSMLRKEYSEDIGVLQGVTLDTVLTMVFGALKMKVASSQNLTLIQPSGNKLS